MLGFSSPKHYKLGFYIKISKKLRMIDYEVVCSILSVIYHTSALIFLTFMAGMIITHTISYFIRKPAVKINQDSLVVVVGACTGIGRIMVT